MSCDSQLRRRLIAAADLPVSRMHVVARPFLFNTTPEIRPSVSTRMFAWQPLAFVPNSTDGPVKPNSAEPVVNPDGKTASIRYLSGGRSRNAYAPTGEVFASYVFVVPT